MRNFGRKWKSSKASEPSQRMKYLRISPLWAVGLMTLSILTLAMGVFAFKSFLGNGGQEDEIAAQEWKPPSLAIVSLDPPKPANVDIESISRPIFSKSRKPSPKAANAVSPSNGTTESGGISVTAIVLNKKILQAYIISSDAPEGAWRKIGDTVDSWNIASIAPKEVVIQNGGQRRTLPLYANVTDQPVNSTGLTPIQPP